MWAGRPACAPSVVHAGEASKRETAGRSRPSDLGRADTRRDTGNRELSPPPPGCACARAALARAPPHAPHHAERFIVRGFCREKTDKFGNCLDAAWFETSRTHCKGATGWHPTVAASKPAVRDGTRFTSIMNRQPPRALYQSPLHAVTRSWSCQPLHMQKSAGSCQPWRRPQQCGYDQVQ